jgi:uncharacterized protein YndB with AHSA1/START domain
MISWECERPIVHATLELPASPDWVWTQWTTADGIRSFFAPQCRVDLRVGGSYEILFLPDAPVGSRGSEGCSVLTIAEPSLFAFTWNNPPRFVDIRAQHTVVQIGITAAAGGGSLVQLWHSGFGRGGSWEAAIRYFASAWPDVVLPRLRRRFEHGPLDWDDPWRP